MGKDSLIKSTSKKKAGAKKEEEKQITKKATAKSAAKKKTATAAKSTKKTATAKKTAAKKATPKTTKKAAAKTTKKTAAKTTKKTAAKTTKKPTAKKPAKAAAAKKPAKSTPAAKTKAAPKKKPSPKPAKKLTVKELVFKKFEPIGPAIPVIPAQRRQATAKAAPPFIATDNPDEAKRLRALLMQKFSMDDIKAAAKEPEPVPEPIAEAPVAETEPAPEAQAEVKPVETSPAADNAYITLEPTEEKPTSDPMTRATKMAAAVVAAVVFLMLSISYNNSSKYYIEPKENAIEIWKGRFSPKDTMFYMVLHGVELDEPLAEVYTSDEVFPLIFNYYLEEADMLLEVPGLPDFDGIKGYLHKARDYVVTSDMKSAVSSRLNNIERMILLYKADVAMSKGTIDSLQSGIKMLKEADVIAATEIQSQEIAQKIEAARSRIQALEAASE